MTERHLLILDSMGPRNIQPILMLNIELALYRIVAPIDGGEGSLISCLAPAHKLIYYLTGPQPAKSA